MLIFLFLFLDIFPMLSLRSHVDALLLANWCALMYALFCQRYFVGALLSCALLTGCRFIHKHKENMTASTRTANMAVANSLQMLQIVVMEFVVIKPQLFSAS